MYTLDILNAQTIGDMLKAMPKVFTRQIYLWMMREKVSFVGGQKKDGLFTKKLLRKKRKYRDGNWVKYVASAFGGEVENQNSLDLMKLRMRIKESRKEDLPFMEMLGSGGNIAPKGKQWLMIPNYKNIFSSGLYGRYGARWKNSFSKLLNNLYKLHINSVLYHGKLLMFGDFPDSSAEGKNLSFYQGHVLRHQHTMNRKLLFTGVKNTSMNQQFDFEGDWKKRLPRVIAHGENTIQRTVRSLERGYLRAE